MKSIGWVLLGFLLGSVMVVSAYDPYESQWMNNQGYFGERQSGMLDRVQQRQFIQRELLDSALPPCP